MKNNKLIDKIIDLILLSETSSKNWVNDVQLKASIYMIVYWGILFIIISFIFQIFDNYITESFLFIIRIFNLLFYLLAICLLFWLTKNYYKYTITKKNQLYLSNILAFFVTTTAIFGLFYSGIYVLFPEFFNYDSPPIDAKKPSLPLNKI